MRNIAFLVSFCITAMFAVACADVQGPIKADVPKSSVVKQGQKVGALKIDPVTQLSQDCTPPFDANCSMLGPNDQEGCIPTETGKGKCELFSTDGMNTYADPFDPTSQNTFNYIPCPGSGASADDDYCATKNPNADSKDYIAKCIVTEQTIKVVPNGGRCAYFFKSCTVGANSNCAQTGTVIPCSGNSCSCSVAADMNLKKTEVCDGVKDEDCDGQVDEEDAEGCVDSWSDSDGDGEGSSGALKQCVCGTQSGLVKNKTDCNDSDKAVNTKATEVCDGADNNCDGSTDEGVKKTFWADGDTDTFGTANSSVQACTAPTGFVENKTDCDDGAKAINPNASDVCDGVDNNCDGKIDESFSNLAQSCGMGACSGGMYMCMADGTGTQCSTLSKVGTETCNSKDDNCDGKTDESYSDLGSGCGTGVCANGSKICKADGSGTECSTLGNAVTDTCDNKDNNCDGKTDESYSDLGSGCGTGVCANGSKICKADGSGTVCSTDGLAGTETCNSKDDNCDGKTDETYSDLGSSCGVGACANGSKVCKADGSGTVCSTESKVSTETCNQIDDDCDGKTDLDSKGVYLCDTGCPTVKKYECNKEYPLDLTTLSGSSTVSTYQCWTAAGAKTLSGNFAAPEFDAAPSVTNGTKFSFQFTSNTVGALASLLHGTCAANANSTAVSAYEATKAPTGTCMSFSTTSVNGGVAGTDYVKIDQIASKGTIKFKFICSP